MAEYFEIKSYSSSSVHAILSKINFSYINESVEKKHLKLISLYFNDSDTGKYIHWAAIHSSFFVNKKINR